MICSICKKNIKPGEYLVKCKFKIKNHQKDQFFARNYELTSIDCSEIPRVPKKLSE